MDFGVHLPLIGFDGRSWSLRNLLEYAETAESLGFAALAANDHLIFSRPWFDGPTALSSVLAASGQMDLMTTVALPVVRGPVQVAKSFTAIDTLADGRLIVGVGPGSSARDYAAGVPFEKRWKRPDEAVMTMRTLWRRDGSTFRGDFYTTEGITLELHPARQAGPPSGSVVGARGQVFAGWPGWATAGSPTPTTLPRNYLRMPGDD
jgi:alkanesulfonate monooxygenase SsuD/methylene tetrahydromethanopterin reductase-like flavin-dependent oxidoreductase (luciferase family)